MLVYILATTKAKMAKYRLSPGLPNRVMATGIDVSGPIGHTRTGIGFVPRRGIPSMGYVWGIRKGYEWGIPEACHPPDRIRPRRITRPCTARHTARRGTAPHGAAHGTARHTARHGTARETTPKLITEKNDIYICIFGVIRIDRNPPL